MKATLHFNLPEDREEFELAQKAGAMFSILHELNEFLRTKTKYAPEDQTKDEIFIYQTVRQKFWDLLDERNVNL